MKRALNGKAKKKWLEITNKRIAWNKANMQEKFYKMLQKLWNSGLQETICSNGWRTVEVKHWAPSVKFLDDKNLRPWGSISYARQHVTQENLWMQQVLLI